MIVLVSLVHNMDASSSIAIRQGLLYRNSENKDLFVGNDARIEIESILMFKYCVKHIMRLRHIVLYCSIWVL